MGYSRTGKIQRCLKNVPTRGIRYTIKLLEGCLIVCSSADASTIEETLKWKKIIEENSDYGNQTNIPCLLVQNKSDLIVPDQVEEYQKKEFLDNFAEKNGFCGTIQCSAKTNSNVEESFQTLLGIIYL